MKNEKNRQFAIIGLGRFGMSILQTLAQHDVDILAVDSDADKITDAARVATHVVQADAGDEDALCALDLGFYDVVVLAMGGDFEATLTAAMLAKEQGARFVMAKVRTLRQKAAMEKLGADRVVLPEHDMGRRVGLGLLSPTLMDVLEQSGKSLIGEMAPRPEWVGKSLRQLNLRQAEGLLVMAVKTGDSLVVPVPPDYVLKQDDSLILLSEAAGG